MSDEYFSSENLNKYLNELAKAYKKLTGGHMKIEITLVGGAAILANYQFRQKSYDIDAVLPVHSVIRDAAKIVGDKFSLPDNWFNSDFMHTESYVPEIERYSVYYREFNHVLQVRTMPPEYIVAMKLKAGRPYKQDFSDVIGILIEQQEKGEPLSVENICKAISNLYESIDNIPETSMDFLYTAFETDDLYEFMEHTVKEEKNAKELLLGFEEDYQDVLNEDNLQEILESLKKKQKNMDYPDLD